MRIIKIKIRRKRKKSSYKQKRKERLGIKYYIFDCKSLSEKIFRLRKEASEGELVINNNYRLLRNFPLPKVRGKCEVCRKSLAYCWHHIKPLSRGGNNADYNLIKVCRECHENIHPFMKERKIKAQEKILFEQYKECLRRTV